MRLLHTADWHVGRTIRGRSRAGEHEAVLAEIAAIAADRSVDLVLVVGDLFDTATPTAESERIVYRALLDLTATGATVVVLAGNHDSDRRLAAVEPLLALGRVVTRPEFVRPDAGGVVTVPSRDGTEHAMVACLPFLSQRHVVRAADLMGGDAAQHGQRYGDRVRRLVAALTAGFGPETVNVVAAHAMVSGGVLGGGERPAHTVFEYDVPGTAFPPTANYVALGHLHRAQVVPGPCPIRYCGSPLNLDFGEGANEPSVVVVDAAPGRPSQAEVVPLTAGRRLRTVRGTLAELAAMAGNTGDDWLRVVVQQGLHIGLADEVRELFPNCVDVVVDDPAQRDGGRGAPGDGPAVAGRSPHELFAMYLAVAGVDDERLLALFDDVLDEAGAGV